MDSINEIELIRQANQGDSAAFEQLVQSYYRFIYQVAFKWSGIKEDAEDITQDVLIKLARKLCQFTEKSSFKTWLYRLIINTAKDHIKKNRTNLAKQVAYFETQKQENKERSESKRVNETLFQLLDTLPPKLKDTALLVYSEGLTHHETAAILKCAETTVSWRVYQVKKKLKKLFQNGEFEW